MEYRQFGCQLLAVMGQFSSRDTTVFLTIVENCNVKDNCLSCTLKEISDQSGIANTTVSTVVGKLTNHNILKKGVIDIHGKKRIMLNPRMIWSTSRSLIHFAQNMYDTGSHFKAYEASKVGEELGGKLDASTGELYSEYQHRYGDTYDIEGNLKGVSRGLYDNQG